MLLGFLRICHYQNDGEKTPDKGLKIPF